MHMAAMLTPDSSFKLTVGFNIHLNTLKISHPFFGHLTCSL